MSNRYHIVKDVPILDEHDIKDDEGKLVARVDSARLHDIARRNNQRIKDTGDLIPIVVGHTKGEPGEYVPEEDQPEIVGYAKGLSVGPFFKTGKKALKATFMYFRNKLDKVRKYPRRSIELWLGDWKIDPISILGATTPQRDLGLLQLSEGGRKFYRRVLPLLIKYKKTEKPPMDHEAVVKGVIEALKQTDVWQFMERLMHESESEGQEDGLEPGVEPEDGYEEPAEEDLEGRDQPVEEGEPEVSPEEEQGREPVQYAMGGGASASSGSNTSTPKFGAMKKKKDCYSKPAQTGSDRVRMSRLERANQGLQSAYNDLRLKFQRSEREKDLIQLEAEGYDLDREEELNHLAHLEDKHYEAALNRIRKRYQRAPVGQSFDLEHSRVTGPVGQGRDRDHAMQIANYASRKGISYEDAMQELGD